MYKDDFDLQCSSPEKDDLRNKVKDLTNVINDLKPLLQDVDSDRVFEFLINVDIFTCKLNELVEDYAFPFANARHIFNISYYFFLDLYDLYKLNIFDENFKSQVDLVKNGLDNFFERLIKTESKFSNPSNPNNYFMN